MFFLFLGFFLLLLYYFITKNHNHWQTKGVPFEKPFLFFGSFYSVATRQQHIISKFREIYDRYKTPYVGIYIFNEPTLVIRSPELIKRVLVKDFDKFSNRKIAADESADPISFHTLFSAKDAHWKNIRSKMSPVFTSGKIKLMFPLMKDCAKDLNTFLEGHHGKIVDVRNVTKKYAVDIISSCAFGINSYCLQNEDSEIMKMANRLINPASLIRSFSLFCFFFLPQFVSIFRLTFGDMVAANYLLDIFRMTMNEREKRKIIRNDLIDIFNSSKKEDSNKDGFKFDDKIMAAQAISFFSAGNDTTSITVSFTLYELALNKEIQDRLRKEVTETYEQAGEFTYDNVQGMKYLDMVLCEALRKYPLTTFINRATSSAYKIEETGVILDKDTQVLIPVAGLHFDPEYYPDPEKFNPERFKDKTELIPYTFMPFGEGPRNCIGQRFALIVTKIALANTIKDFAFEPSNLTTIPIQFDNKAFFLESKGGVHLKLTKV